MSDNARERHDGDANTETSFRFTASRRELVDGDTSDAEPALALARSIVGGASRCRSLLRVQRSGHRRVDVWSSELGLCVHNQIGDPDSPTSGSSSPAPYQEMALAAVVANLLGPLPSGVGTSSMVLDTEALRDPTRIPADIDRLLGCWDDTGGSSRVVAAVSTRGCFVGRTDRIDSSLRLDGCSAAELWSVIRDEVLS